MDNKIILFLNVMLASNLIFSAPCSPDNPNWERRGSEGNTVEIRRMDFESRVLIENVPVVCIEEEHVPVWNDAEMAAYLLDGVEYYRVKESER
jgi:hypothetical protein